MADTKITALAAIGANPINVATFPIPMVDLLDNSMAASGTTKKVTVNQILGAGGTATLASATITGDLTVDTSTLKVDSANDRVGVGTVSPTAKLHVSSTGSVHINQRTGGNGCFTQYVDPVSSNYVGTDSGNFRVANNSAQDLLNIQQLGVFSFGDGAGGTRMTLNSTGLGVGVTPSAWVSYQKSIDFGGAGNYGSVSARANFAAFATNCYFDGTNWIYKNTNPANLYEQSAGANVWRTAPSGTAGTAITGANAFVQAMTLDASGNLLVGTTTTSGNAGGLKLSNVGGTLGQITFSNNSGVADYVARFNYGSTPTLVGTITVASGGTTYNTTSDYRLKESVQPLVGGLARVSALKPSIYKWKSDGSSGEGFLAHELAEVVPFAVTGEKDAVNEDGSVKAQGVDLSRVVPILVAAIQELAAEVNALKNA